MVTQHRTRRLWVNTLWALLWFLRTPGLAVAGYNQCTILGGKCMYHIQLAEGCHDDQLLTNRVQNDYNERVNEIEKKLGDVKEDYADRIRTLENQVLVLLEDKVPGQGSGLDPETRGPGHHGRDPEQSHVGSRHRHSGDRGGSVTPDTVTPTVKSTSVIDTSTFSEDPERSENGLLNMLHTEFTQLRRELAAAKRKLRDTEKLLRESRRQANATATELVLTTRKLVAMESDLEDSENEKQKVQEELDEKTRELNETSMEMHATRRKLRHTQLELAVAGQDNVDLQKDLEACHRDLEDARRVLERALRKYHELNVKHENTTQELVASEEDLVECFKGKTAQFCGFEDPDICGFTQENETDILDWTRWSKNTPSARTGPSLDHTCNSKNGYYMYVEATERTQGHNARMVSPRYQGSSEQCMEFYYHMYGKHIGTLNVYTLVIGQDLPPPTWRGFGNQGNVWTMAKLTIPKAVARKGYQVVFEAILETGYLGDLAVDDVRIFDGKCYNAKTLDQVRYEDQDVRRAIMADERNKTKQKAKEAKEAAKRAAAAQPRT